MPDLEIMVSPNAGVESGGFEAELEDPEEDRIPRVREVAERPIVEPDQYFEASSEDQGDFRPQASSNPMTSAAFAGL